jgi:RecA-family ATPase
MARSKSVPTESSSPLPQDTDASLPYCKAKVAKESKAEWLIPGWLPLGHLVMLDGDKGAGKSYLAAAFAGHVSGRQPLAGFPACKPSGVIWGAGEESVAADTRPKLRAAGADLHRVYFLGMDAAGRRASSPSFPADLPGLEAMIRETKSSLVYLDPLRSYLSVNLSPGDEKGNGAVAVEMGRIAERTRSTILCCRHLTKVAARDPLHSGTGSVAWGAVARMLLRAEEQETDGWERVLSVVRTNRGKPAAPRCYSIVETDAGVLVDWGPTLDKDQVKLMSSLFDDGQKLESRVAEELIRKELSKGPRHASEIYMAGERERIGKSAMWRAASKIGVISTRKGFGGEGYFEWLLPSDDAPPPHTRSKKSMNESGS